MCLAKVYMAGQEKEPVLEDVASIQIEEGKVRAFTLFGETREIAGYLNSIDFEKSVIVLGKAP